MVSTTENPPQDRYGSQNPTAQSKHDQVQIQTCWAPDFLPAPICGNIHWQTPRADGRPDQQDRRARGSSSHTPHRGDEHHNSAFTAYFIHRCESRHSKFVWLSLQVEPFTPREFTCEGMLERVHAYVTHQVPICCKCIGVLKDYLTKPEQ